MTKEAGVYPKVVPIPTTLQLFPQRLVKNTENGKCRQFIFTLKLLSINVPLKEAWTQMLGYAKFMKDMVTKKRSLSF